MSQRGPDVARIRRNPYSRADVLTGQLAHLAFDPRLCGGELARFALDVRAQHGFDVALAALLKLVNRYVGSGE